MNKLSLWQKYLISRELTGKRLIPYAKIQQMIVRQPPSNYLQRLHPRVKAVYNKRIQKLEPLKFKLQEYSPISINTPLGKTENLPFQIKRTHTNNLPVYSNYKHGHLVKKTIVRLCYGDLHELKTELEKITSNSNVYIKTGKVVIDGLHKKKVNDYLLRLGF